VRTGEKRRSPQSSAGEGSKRSKKVSESAVDVAVQNVVSAQQSLRNTLVGSTPAEAVIECAEKIAANQGQIMQDQDVLGQKVVAQERVGAQMDEGVIAVASKHSSPAEKRALDDVRTVVEVLRHQADDLKGDIARLSQENKQTMATVGAILNDIPGPVPAPVMAGIARVDENAEVIDGNKDAIESVKPFKILNVNKKGVSFRLGVKTSRLGHGRGLFVIDGSVPDTYIMHRYIVGPGRKVTNGMVLVSDVDMIKRIPTGYGIRLNNTLYADLETDGDTHHDPVMLEKPISIFVRLNQHADTVKNVNATLHLYKSPNSGEWTVYLQSSRKIANGEEITVSNGEMYHQGMQRFQSPIKTPKISSPAVASKIVRQTEESMKEMQTAINLKIGYVKNLPRFWGMSCHLDSFLAAMFACKLDNDNIFNFLDGHLMDAGTIDDKGRISIQNVDKIFQTQKYFVLRDFLNLIITTKGNKALVSPVDAARTNMRRRFVGERDMDRMESPIEWVKRFPDLFDMKYFVTGKCPTHGSQTHRFRSNTTAIDAPTVEEAVALKLAFAGITSRCSKRDCNKTLLDPTRNMFELPRVMVVSGELFDRFYTVNWKGNPDDHVKEYNYPNVGNSVGTVRYRLIAIFHFEHKHYTVFLNLTHAWIKYDDTTVDDPEPVEKDGPPMTGNIAFLLKIDP
jgi:hypothetical protein